jgi:four helix bundle protein
MDELELRKRTKRFALDVMRFTEALPRKRTTDVIGKQLLRCGTSVGANYRSACRARSKPDFISKMGIVLEEADEALYWNCSRKASLYRAKRSGLWRKRPMSWYR